MQPNNVGSKHLASIATMLLSASWSHATSYTPKVGVKPKTTAAIQICASKLVIDATSLEKPQLRYSRNLERKVASFPSKRKSAQWYYNQQHPKAKHTAIAIG